MVSLSLRNGHKVITKQIKQRVLDKVREGIDLIEKHYKKTISVPAVVYAVGGATAGTANHRTYTIDINPVLLMENLDDMIDNTVPHELAHLACHTIYPEAYQSSVRMVMGRRGWQMRRTKREIHGWQWQEIMRVLGADPARTHKYDVSNVSHRKARYEYRCSGCEHVMQIGPKIHKQLQRDPDCRWHKGCKGHRLVLIGKKAPAPVVVPPMALAVPTTGTKQQRASALYRANAGTPRSAMIQMFMRELGMTQAGASTYYYNCQKAA